MSAAAGHEDLGDALRDHLASPEFHAQLAPLLLDLSRLRDGRGAGELALRRAGMGSRFREHRPYAAGDDPRAVDWNAWLRLGELVVKTYDAEAAPRVGLIVDSSASMGLAAGKAAWRAAEVVASLGLLALRDGATLLFAGGKEGEPARRFQGQRQQKPFLDALSRMEVGGFADLPRSVSAQSHAMGIAGALIVVSDFLEHAGLEQALRGARQRGHEILLLRIRDEAVYRLPKREGRTVVIDPETGARRTVRMDAALRAAYLQVLSAHERGLQGLSRTLGLELQTISPAEDLREALRRVVTRLRPAR